jgi:hypothetical protein
MLQRRIWAPPDAATRRPRHHQDHLDACSSAIGDPDPVMRVVYGNTAGQRGACPARTYGRCPRRARHGGFIAEGQQVDLFAISSRCRCADTFCDELTDAL